MRPYPNTSYGSYPITQLSPSSPSRTKTTITKSAKVRWEPRCYVLSQLSDGPIQPPLILFDTNERLDLQQDKNGQVVQNRQ